MSRVIASKAATLPFQNCSVAVVQLHTFGLGPDDGLEAVSLLFEIAVYPFSLPDVEGHGQQAGSLVTVQVKRYGLGLKSASAPLKGDEFVRHTAGSAPRHVLAETAIGRVIFGRDEAVNGLADCA